jgi:hypothetical protein
MGMGEQESRQSRSRSAWKTGYCDSLAYSIARTSEVQIIQDKLEHRGRSLPRRPKPTLPKGPNLIRSTDCGVHLITRHLKRAPHTLLVQVMGLNDLAAHRCASRECETAVSVP